MFFDVCFLETFKYDRKKLMEFGASGCFAFFNLLFSIGSEA